MKYTYSIDDTNNHIYVSVDIEGTIYKYKDFIDSVLNQLYEQEDLISLMKTLFQKDEISWQEFCDLYEDDVIQLKFNLTKAG